MTVVRLAATAGLLAGALATLFGGCGTDAVGVDDCRDIEQARCEASVPCGDIDDVGACQRFYRDHCLHGLGLENSPGNLQVQACVRAIEAAGQCAKEGKTVVPDCTALAAETSLGSVCEAVRKPDKLTACSFLAALPVTPVPPVQDSGDAAKDASSEAASDSATD